MQSLPIHIRGILGRLDRSIEYFLVCKKRHCVCKLRYGTVKGKVIHKDQERGGLSTRDFVLQYQVVVKNSTERGQADRYYEMDLRSGTDRPANQVSPERPREAV